MTGKHFTISVPPSSASTSRSASPALDDAEEKINRIYDAAPGQHATDVYDTTLPPFRALIRRKLVKIVEKESRVLARLQKAVRTPLGDSYFVYTSLLGTHTFFMILLPCFAFFGRQDIARGLIMVLAAGVYLSSVLKDMFCSPRPFAPPVVRLTIGSHHLEYGFPSTHSTNSVSMALFFFSIFHALRHNDTPSITSQEFYTIVAVLTFYTFSIVFGRLYTGMHSFTDCITGTVLGAGIWWGHDSWVGHAVTISPSNPLYAVSTALGLGESSNKGLVVYLGKGLGAGRWIEQWSENGGWKVPFILIPLCLLAVNQHPQPVDDCPCFEDAIAFGSVVLGALVGRWAMHTAGMNSEAGGPSIMPGSGLVQDAITGQWMTVDRNWGDIGVWWTFAVLKLTVGILAIFVWRIIAKSALHLILPPTFRLLSRAFRLPNRRFYTPATEYKNVPSEFQVGEDGNIALQAIPSVIDLPSSAGVMFETGGIGSGTDGSSHWGHAAGKRKKKNMRPVNGSSVKEPSPLKSEINSVMLTRSRQPDAETQSSKARGVKHYDADVLTKVIVYAGIAFLACEALPLVFEYLGWGLRYWI
ncbi:sphingosine-1-phosphate phosphatase [Coprinopsis marcescibilis]|uniref:Sphingosine-1-phosphate phosphatase n=1 Tax=Coprinopsis marcescibilis TaxID=230819 RepID=A0A5C3KN49_COPMA|nr:sphingosine-1-phosphate phosphatase [Coprinopsis marcescibilis]